MVYKITVESKVIDMTDNKKTVLEILDDVLNSCGLKVEAAQAAIADLVPGEPADLAGLLNKLVGKAEKIGFSFGAKGRLLPPFSIELDDVGERLLQEYINDWIDIANSAGFTSEDMESHHINSSRVLVMEIFIRVVMQALRQDSKLPADSKFDRSIWLNVLSKLSEAFVSDKYNLKLKEAELNKFLIDIEQIHVRWIDWLKGSIARIDEIEKAKTIISTNLENIKARELHIMRHIVIALCGREGAKKADRGCFADRQIRKTLERTQLKKINEFNVPQLKLVLEQKYRASILKAEGNLVDELSCKEYELDILPWLSKQEISLQNILCQYSKDKHLKCLYGLLNWTKLIVKMIEKIDEVVNLGGWVPLLMGLMELGKVDELLLTHQKLYKLLIDPKQDIYNINDTVLRQELSKYNLKDADRDVGKLGKMEQLRNKELLNRIADRFTDAFSGLAALGGLLNCSVMNIDACAPAISLMEPVKIEYVEHKNVTRLTSASDESLKKKRSSLPLTIISSASALFNAGDEKKKKGDTIVIASGKREEERNAERMQKMIVEMDLKLEKIETQLNILK